MKKKFVYSCLAATLCFSTGLVGQAPAVFAADVSKVADKLMKENPKMIEDWKGAGATESEIKSFVDDVAKNVKTDGLTESNINERFLSSFMSVRGKHKNAVDAALETFSLDGLKPIRDSVKEEVLGNTNNSGGSSNGGSSSGGGGGTTNKNDKTDTDKSDEKQEEKVEEKPTPAPTPSTPVFSDIAGHWAEKEIVKMYEAGIVRGTDGKANPNNPITRAEFATLLVNLLDLKETTQMNFKDAKSDAWYYENLAKAYHAGLLRGYSADQIGPNDTITREQMASMVYSALKIKGVPVNTEKALTFTDANKIAPWAVESVKATHAAGIINGFPDKTFAPQGQATRAQAIVMISFLSNM
ncbi:hypothetical protein BEP19_13430 [Ammoniphilus oxalaticus]|uniref:SLH domain-containing protein n=1 Tax=Ammoniphilus oxalaticus TaxID=66863 RepID=A0A419SF39_9BACL|nr:S-layer homology domain-containing protein [Ammoniphilus oxalaticus]RKD22069.1 hypothetical protein BEP19_13430 [Ammoniphilus oxalaticus]